MQDISIDERGPFVQESVDGNLEQVSMAPDEGNQCISQKILTGCWGKYIQIFRHQQIS
jgi:hypothetical protein